MNDVNLRQIRIHKLKKYRHDALHEYYNRLDTTLFVNLEDNCMFRIECIYGIIGDLKLLYKQNQELNIEKELLIILKTISLLKVELHELQLYLQSNYIYID